MPRSFALTLSILSAFIFATANSSRDFTAASRQILRVKIPAQPFALVAALLFQTCVQACMWDSDTLRDEKKARPKMAKAILGKAPDLGDPTKLRKRITELQSNRRENDPAWWNDLAGAHIRLGESKTAAELLESVVARFSDDYGVHANLGTAYHLLGRYQEAEKEIARDLEINPDAHFGLEKYHLALLQYLIRDTKYQTRHVYVDEFTPGFLYASHGTYSRTTSIEAVFKELAQDYTNGLAEAEADYEAIAKTSQNESMGNQMLGTVAMLDPQPVYRSKWNLLEDAKLEEGVIYMASLNPKEPACFVMLGVVSWSKGDLNLTAAAFDKAINLGSTQADLLNSKLAAIREHITKARNINRTWPLSIVPTIIAVVCITALVAILAKGFVRKKA